MHSAQAPGESGGHWQLPRHPPAPGQGRLEAHLVRLSRAPGPSQQGSWPQVVGTACFCRLPPLMMAQAGETHSCTQDSLGRRGQDRRARLGSVGAEPSPRARSTRGPGHARAEQVGRRGAFPAPLSHSRDCLLGRLYLNTQRGHQGCMRGAIRGLSPPPPADTVATLATHVLCHCENKHADFRWALTAECMALSQPGAARAERGSPWGHGAATVKPTSTWGRTRKLCALSPHRRRSWSFSKVVKELLRLRWPAFGEKSRADQ